MPTAPEQPEEKIFETWGEIAQNLGYSITRLEHLWMRCKFPLKYRFHKRCRMKMTLEELIRFKQLIQNLVKG